MLVSVGDTDSGPAVLCLRTGEPFSFRAWPVTKIKGRALGGGRCSGERLMGISDRVWDVRPSKGFSGDPTDLIKKFRIRVRIRRNSVARGLPITDAIEIQKGSTVSKKIT
jgi:hypothetical protein